jgi:hypothetical protein
MPFAHCSFLIAHSSLHKKGVAMLVFWGIIFFFLYVCKGTENLTIQAISSIIVILFGLLAIIANIFCLYSNHRNRELIKNHQKGHSSFIYWLGGAVMFVGILFFPKGVLIDSVYYTIRRFAFLAFVIDISYFATIYSIIYSIREKIKERKELKALKKQKKEHKK